MNLTQTMEPGVCSLWAFFVSGIAAGQQTGVTLEPEVRLLGCALAMLVLAVMSVTTGSFAKAADARDAAQANHVAAEDVVWEMK